LPIRMKLLLVNAFPDLVRSIAHRVDGVTILASPHRQSEYEGLPSSCRVIPFVQRAKVDPAAILTLRRIIRDVQPDIVHAFPPRSLAAAVLATITLPRSPRLVSFRGIAHTPSWLAPSDLLTFLCPKVAIHCCESNACADHLVEAGVPKSKCETIYNCVREEPPPFSRQQLRERFNIPSDAFVVGTTATIRPVKGTDILLEAAARCVDLPDIYWLLIGPVHDARVEKLVRAPLYGGRLRMTGPLANAGVLANAFDLFVMPSRQEALCKALLEAMSQGACPVVSDAGGMKELVRDGVDGVVVPRENVQALADAIRLLHADRDRVQRYAGSARQRVQEMCSPEVMADRVLRVYARLMGPSS